MRTVPPFPCNVLGVDLKLHFSSGGRPVPILADGKPIAELV